MTIDPHCHFGGGRFSGCCSYEYTFTGRVLVANYSIHAIFDIESPTTVPTSIGETRAPTMYSTHAPSSLPTLFPSISPSSSPSLAVHVPMDLTVDPEPFFVNNGSLRVDIDNIERLICQHIPSDAIGMQVQMGEVLDNFRPIPGKTMCEMVMSHENHLYYDGVAWVWPNHLDVPDLQLGFWGGSVRYFPQRHRNDNRDVLSMWGTPTRAQFTWTGGCYALSYSSNGNVWSSGGLAFTLNAIYVTQSPTISPTAPTSAPTLLPSSFQSVAPSTYPSVAPSLTPSSVPHTMAITTFTSNLNSNSTEAGMSGSLIGIIVGMFLVVIATTSIITFFIMRRNNHPKPHHESSVVSFTNNHSVDIVTSTTNPVSIVSNGANVGDGSQTYEIPVSLNTEYSTTMQAQHHHNVDSDDTSSVYLAPTPLQSTSGSRSVSVLESCTDGYGSIGQQYVETNNGTEYNVFRDPSQIMYSDISDISSEGYGFGGTSSQPDNSSNVTGNMYEYIEVNTVSDTTTNDNGIYDLGNL